VTPASVSVHTVLRMLRPHLGWPIQTSLTYEQALPFEVALTITNGDELTVWRFARELLTEGIDGAAGLGDVRVFPHRNPSGPAVAILLDAPEGVWLLEADRRVVARFLKRSFVLVSRGRESEYANVDAGLARLLAGESR
jgi:hypothetical protein